MFVRWVIRHRQKGDVLCGYLCQSKWIDGKVHSATLAYLGSIETRYLPVREQRAAFWEKARENLKSYGFSRPEQKEIETGIALGVPHPKTKWSAVLSKVTVEWYTPESYIELARQVMGSIDLDPASNELAQSWIKATTFYTAADDGLSKLWLGRMWLNPPYTGVEYWTEKAIKEYDAGNIEQAILLVRPATSSGWYQELEERFYRCGTNKRIRFIDKDGTPQTRPTHGNAFFYLGEDCQRFKEVFQQIGKITMPA